MAPAIKVQDLSKSYTIEHQARRGYRTLREEFTSRIRALGGAGRAVRRQTTTEQFWALREVSFDIEPGDRVGIVGRNGAGKSTLLKVLSRITDPTNGRVEIEGRVASLLEVGTGFHPELSGRENIFLNGAILGMRAAEIRAKFDEIVAFSEVEQFLDVPVKRYSSGMYVRLAFSVAAHLEPDILLVDEVLAVGDAAFQSKCLGKMQDVSGKQGRTVLFVSHQMGSIMRLCDRAIYLSQGQIKQMGPTAEVIQTYLGQSDSGVQGWTRGDELGDSRPIRLLTIQTRAGDRLSSEFGFHEDIILACRIAAEASVAECKISITVQDQFQNYVSTVVARLSDFPIENQVIQGELAIPGGILAPNSYSFRLALFEGKQRAIDIVDLACPFRIVDTGSSMSEYEGMNYGNVILPFRWITR